MVYPVKCLHLIYAKYACMLLFIFYINNLANILPANSHEPAEQQSALPEGLYNTLSLEPEIKSEPDPDWEYQPPKPTCFRCVDFLMMTNWEMLIKALIIYFTIFAIFMHIAVKHDVMESMKF